MKKTHKLFAVAAGLLLGRILYARKVSPVTVGAANVAIGVAILAKYRGR